MKSNSTTLNGTPKRALSTITNKKVFTVKATTQTCWPTHKTKVMETLNETQTQNKNATSLWQTIGMYIGMMVGFLYPQIGLGLGMLLGIALGRLVLTKIPVNTPLAQRAQQKSAIILILAFLILFMNHWYVPCKHAIAHLMN